MWTEMSLFSDTSQTVMEMIKQEITKLGYELWQPPLGGAGVVVHESRPAIFSSGQNRQK